ncbi:MAG: hypothetical protein MR561_10560 [Prevotella sp.]|nr:hypothetical protein [Prevotella sp.]
MKTFSPYISIILDEEDFEAEQICRINKFAEVKTGVFGNCFIPSLVI